MLCWRTALGPIRGRIVYETELFPLLLLYTKTDRLDQILLLLHGPLFALKVVFNLLLSHFALNSVDEMRFNFLRLLLRLKPFREEVLPSFIVILVWVIFFKFVRVDRAVGLSRRFEVDGVLLYRNWSLRRGVVRASKGALPRLLPLQTLLIQLLLRYGSCLCRQLNA